MTKSSESYRNNQASRPTAQNQDGFYNPYGAEGQEWDPTAPRTEMHYMPPTFGQAESADYVSSVYQTDDTHREAPADAQTQQFSYAAPSMDAQALGSIGQTAEMYTQSKAHNGKMSRKEKKALKAEQKAQKRELAARQKASRKKSQSLKAQLKQRDKR